MRGRAGLDKRANMKGAGNSSEDGARISLPTIGISAGPARRGRGRTRESGRKGGGGTRLKGNMPGERGRGGGTVGDRETDQGGRRRLERGGRREEGYGRRVRGERKRKEERGYEGERREEGGWMGRKEQDGNSANVPGNPKRGRHPSRKR